MTAWLTALPGNVRKKVEEKDLVTTWKKDHFFGTLVEFFELKKHIPVDEEAAETGEVASSQKRKRWLPLKKRVANSLWRAIARDKVTHMEHALRNKTKTNDCGVIVVFGKKRKAREVRKHCEGLRTQLAVSS